MGHDVLQLLKVLHHTGLYLEAVKALRDGGFHDGDAGRSYGQIVSHACEVLYRWSTCSVGWLHVHA